MPNILLTTSCNRSCPYCFATREMEGSEPGDRMSWENLIYIADFLVASGLRSASFLGGEPTLHPECIDFLLYFLERGFDVTVFTNGILSEARLAEFERHLAGVPGNRLTFVCNLNDPVLTPAPHGESERVHRFLSALGPRVMPGFNLYRLDFQLDFLFEAMVRYGMKRSLRLGVAHPVPGAESGFIRPEDLPEVINRLCSFQESFRDLRITPVLDCGFPLCKFTDEQLGWLRRSSNSLQFKCGPAFDITPGMEVYYCFPLCDFRRKSLFDFDSVREIEEHFATIQRQLRGSIPGIYEECRECHYREDGLCAGGGMCQALNRMVRDPSLGTGEIEHELAKYRLSP